MTFELVCVKMSVRNEISLKLQLQQKSLLLRIGGIFLRCCDSVVRLEGNCFDYRLIV